jgi:hypothetical protein
VGKEPWSDLSVQIGSRPWRIVPDPLLCMTRDGAALVGGLAGSHVVGHSPRAEVWLAKEFHSILDDWMMHNKHPELLAQSLGGPEDPEELRQALRLWLRLRDAAGRPDGRLCWVRDALRESCLPAGIEDSIVPRWEAMVQALHERMPSAHEASGPGIAAFRDCAALCAVLTDALILCPLKSDGMPSLCRHLEAWRLHCRRLEITDDLVALERSLLLRLLVELGLAGFVWGGLKLAVVHLAIPGLFRLSDGGGFALDPEDFDFALDELRPIKNPWEDAQAFWYELGGGETYA